MYIEYMSPHYGVMVATYASNRRLPYADVRTWLEQAGAKQGMSPVLRYNALCIHNPTTGDPPYERLNSSGDDRRRDFRP